MDQSVQNRKQTPHAQAEKPSFYLKFTAPFAGNGKYKIRSSGNKTDEQTSNIAHENSKETNTNDTSTTQSQQEANEEENTTSKDKERSMEKNK